VVVIAPRLYAAWKADTTGADEVDAFADFARESAEVRDVWEHVARVAIAASVATLEKAGWEFRDPRTPPPGMDG